MPKRTDIKKILLIGSGPIVIGQACEFDYSGTQAAKALRADGYEVILVNSNPATIMTDPDLADKTYVEPLTLPYLEEIIRRERPDALLSTVGGQTGLNLSVELAEAGVLAERQDVREELIRLAAHLDDFSERLAKGRLEGKAVDVWCQEVLRELNTTGSKCKRIDMTRAVMEAKGVLDQIREQSANLE